MAVPSEREITYFLQSSRLGFRYWTHDDLPLILALFGEPSIYRWMGGPFTEQAVHARLEDEMHRQRHFSMQYWPIFLRVAGEFAGCAGLRPRTEGVFELGYHLMPPFRGQGLATEAATTVADYAFSVLKVASLFAGHHPANAASRRVLLKLGFEQTGEEFYEPTGVIEPVYLLTQSRWHVRPGEHQSTKPPAA